MVIRKGVTCSTVADVKTSHDTANVVEAQLMDKYRWTLSKFGEKISFLIGQFASLSMTENNMTKLMEQCEVHPAIWLIRYSPFSYPEKPSSLNVSANARFDGVNAE